MFLIDVDDVCLWEELRTVDSVELTVSLDVVVETLLGGELLVALIVVEHELIAAQQLPIESRWYRLPVEIHTAELPNRQYLW